MQCVTEVGCLGDGTTLVMCDLHTSQADVIGKQQLEQAKLLVLVTYIPCT